jgi:hypothetical protein
MLLICLCDAHAWLHSERSQVSNNTRLYMCAVTQLCVTQHIHHSITALPCALTSRHGVYNVWSITFYLTGSNSLCFILVFCCYDNVLRRLRRPIYKQTAVHGHFGRTDHSWPWENVKILQIVLPDSTDMDTIHDTAAAAAAPEPQDRLERQASDIPPTELTGIPIKDTDALSPLLPVDRAMIG